MKNSNKLLIGLVLLLLAAPIWYAFILTQKVEKATLTEPRPEFIFPTSGAQEDYSITVDPFRYIFSDGVAVQLDTGQWEVTLRTFEMYFPKCLIEVRNDTLFLSKDSSLPPMRSHWGIVHVKAPRLTGMTVINKGSVQCDNVKANFNSDHLEIIAGEGSIQLPLNSRSLDLHYLGPGNVALIGSVDRMNVYGHESAGSLNAFYLEADTAYVHSSGQHSFQIYVQNYLEANLLNSYGNLAYRGHPTVVKKENARGRVVNVNRITK